jgi:uncharacterized protein
MSNTNNQFIGQGITFPIEIDLNGRAVINNGFDLIEASIITILNWPKRDRFFNELFGARLWELIEEPNDNIGRTLVRTFIMESIELWEPRIELLEVNIIDSTITPEKIDIELSYEIRSSRIANTFIFPFYKELIY